MFACATATKEVSIIQHMRVLLSLSKFVQDFWTRDAEMTAVAIAGDVAGSKPAAGEATGPPQPRLGQLVLFIQIVSQLRVGRLGKTTQVLESVSQSLLR
jgi:hypothetical protein